MPVALDDVRRLAAEVIAPAHFFVAPDLDLEWGQREREETAWELFRGRLLDPAHTRERAVFATWDVWERTPEGRSDEPVLSLKLDETAGVLHVVRGLECYVWEGYDSGGGVILSRERRKWVRELVATLRLADFAEEADFREELTYGLYSAVVGASRLPLTSVEAPLPSFSFGRLFYCPREAPPPDARPSRTWRDLIRHLPLFSFLVSPHWMEAFLHAVPVDELPLATVELMNAPCWPSDPPPQVEVLFLVRRMFNGASLSPWTDLTEKALAFLRACREGALLGAEAKYGMYNLLLGDVLVIDCLAHLLRQTCRHLTAYDLVTFHHRGANYPDALLLDLVVKEYLAWIERRPDCFVDDSTEDSAHRGSKRMRRRALRQAWLVRRRYEEHPVPDAPTSSGENNRVLPPSHPRVPEEQILQPAFRRRKLYDNDPLTNHLGRQGTIILRQSVHDLAHESGVELRELGAALFLDRPLSSGKALGEPDATLILANVAFSRAIAVQRVRALAGELVLADVRPVLDDCLQRLMTAPPRGLPLDRIGGPSQPGVLSLTDARLASPDFEFLRMTAGAYCSLVQVFDFGPLRSLHCAEWTNHVLTRPPDRSTLHLYDDQGRLRMELAPDFTSGVSHRGGVEYPRAGLIVRRLWIEDSDGSLQEYPLEVLLRLTPRLVATPAKERIVAPFDTYDLIQRSGGIVFEGKAR